ncbi:SCR [Medicago truncatula]|uniref:SCR n=1 Tax=Medicago truncatula TaxID=3880 RepID=A0A072TY38_MEDTR|nr:SCR [Medicago truncatula]
MKLGNTLLIVAALFTLFTYGSAKFCFQDLTNNGDCSKNSCEQEFVESFGSGSQPYGCRCDTTLDNKHICSCCASCGPNAKGLVCPPPHRPKTRFF